jgi:hypothetical protein
MAGKDITASCFTVNPSPISVNGRPNENNEILSFTSSRDRKDKITISLYYPFKERHDSLEDEYERGDESRPESQADQSESHLENAHLVKKNPC